MVRQVNKEKLSITLDREVFDALSKLAEDDDRSISSMINKILRDQLLREKKE